MNIIIADLDSNKQLDKLAMTGLTGGYTPNPFGPYPPRPFPFPFFRQPLFRPRLNLSLRANALRVGRLGMQYRR